MPRQSLMAKAQPSELEVVDMFYWPRQDLASQLMRQVHQLLYGGAAGGGKDQMAVQYAIEYIREYEPVARAARKTLQVWIFRENLDDLDDTMIPRFRELALEPGFGRWVESKRQFEVANGHAVVYFRHCATDKAVAQYDSAEMHLLIINECALMSEFRLKRLMARNRSAIKGVPAKTLLLTNPGGESNDYLKEEFVNPAPPETPFTVEVNVPLPNGQTLTTKRIRAFVPSFVWDNPSLLESEEGKAYIANLYALPKEERDQKLYGIWDKPEGRFFSAFDRGRHVVDSFKPDARWPRWRAIDVGGTDPWVCLWGCQHPQTRRIYAYRELRQRNLTTSQFKDKVVSLSSDEDIHYTVGDPAGRQRQKDSRISIYDVLADGDHPIFVRPANNDIEDGLRQIRNLIGTDLADGLPALQITNDCTWLIKELTGALIHEKNGNRIADPTQNDQRRDDCIDTLRYLVMERRALLPARPEEPEEDALALLGRAQARRLALAGKDR